MAASFFFGCFLLILPNDFPNSFKENKFMLYKYLTGIFCAVLPLTGFTQVRSVNISGQSFSWAVRITQDAHVTGIVGSPYLNRDWMYGKLELNSRQSLTGLFRFNLLDQEMEMVVGKDTMRILNPYEINKIEFSNKSFYFLPIIEKYRGSETLRFGYAEKIADGNTEFYKDYTVEIKNNSYASNYMAGGGDGLDYLHQRSRLLYRSYENEALRVWPNKPKLQAEVMGITRQELLKLVREKKLDMKQERDILSLIDLIKH